MLHLLNKYPFLKATLAGLLCALMFILAIPGSPFPFLIFIALVPVFLLRDSVSVTASAIAWTLAGLGFIAGTTYWMFYYLAAVFDYNYITCFTMTAISCLIPAGSYLITGILSQKSHKHNLPLNWLTIPLANAALIGTIFAVFPSHLGTILYQHPIFMQHADIAGGIFVHLTFVLINALIAEIIYSTYKHKTLCKKLSLTLLALLLFILTYGAFRLHQFDTKKQHATPEQFTQIGYVQPNLPGIHLIDFFPPYLSDDVFDNDINYTLELSGKLIAKYPSLDLLLWPETPDDFPIYEKAWIRNGIKKTLSKSSKNTPLLVVSMLPYRSGKPYLFGTNTTFLIQPSGEITHPYSKVKLIPFAEYLPFEDKFPILRKFFPYCGQMTPGTVTNPITLDNGTKVSPIICYDPIFSRLVRKVALTGSQILLSLDNDTNFGPTNATLGHLAVSYFRTIENRLPMVRVSNNGLSCTIEASGRFVSDSFIELYSSGSKAVNLLPSDPTSRTFFQIAGFRLPEALLVLLSIFYIYTYFKRK